MDRAIQSALHKAKDSARCTSRGERTRAQDDSEWQTEIRPLSIEQTSDLFQRKHWRDRKRLQRDKVDQTPFWSQMKYVYHALSPSLSLSHTHTHTRHKTRLLIYRRNDMVCHIRYYIIKYCTNKTLHHHHHHCWERVAKIQCVFTTLIVALSPVTGGCHNCY